MRDCLVPRSRWRGQYVGARRVETSIVRFGGPDEEIRVACCARGGGNAGRGGERVGWAADGGWGVLRLRGEPDPSHRGQRRTGALRLLHRSRWDDQGRELRTGHLQSPTGRSHSRLSIWYGGKCLFFTKTASDAPGTFQRLHPGQTAFTYCRNCEIDGRTGNFTLKISYPRPKSFQGDPAETLPFTKFTIQDATGKLAGLRGQGTLDFLTGCYTMNYQFVK